MNWGRTGAETWTPCWPKIVVLIFCASTAEAIDPNSIISRSPFFSNFQPGNKSARCSAHIHLLVVAALLSSELDIRQSRSDDNDEDEDDDNDDDGYDDRRPSPRLSMLRR